MFVSDVYLSLLWKMLTSIIFLYGYQTGYNLENTETRRPGTNIEQLTLQNMWNQLKPPKKRGPE